MYTFVICKMYIFVVSCSGRNMDNAEVMNLKDPKFYNNPEQYDEFLRCVFASHPKAATVTSSRPFYHFRWHCQHCFFPANSPAQFKAHTADCPGGKDNISVFCGHCGHTYTTREQLHIHANRYGFHTQHSHIPNYTTRHHWPHPSPSVSVADTTLSTSTALQTPTQTQTHTTATTASDTPSSFTSLSSTTPVSDTQDDLPNLSLDSDLSTSLHLPDNLDDPSTSLDLTLTDLDEILAAEPFASSTPSLNSTTHTPHAFHPFADNTTSHTSHRFSPTPHQQIHHQHCHCHTDTQHQTLHHLLLPPLLLPPHILPLTLTTHS